MSDLRLSRFPSSAASPTPAPARSGAGFASHLPGLALGAARIAASVGGSGAGAAAISALQSVDKAAQMDQMWAMQRESQAFNMEYLALQESIQSENRSFTTLSNLSKAQHETAKAAISNLRV